MGDAASCAARPKLVQALSLRANFSWTLAGNLVAYAANWAILAALAKMGTKMAVGQYTDALTVAQPVMIFAQMGLRVVQATDQRESHRFGSYVAVRISCMALALMVSMAVALWGPFSHAAAPALMVLAVALVLDGFSDVMYGLMQQKECMDRIAVSMIVRNLLALAGVIGGYYLTHSVAWAMVGSAVGYLVVLCTYDTLSASRLLGTTGGRKRRLEAWRPVWDRAAMRDIIATGFPLALMSLFILLNTRGPQFIVGRLLGEGALGLFAGVASLYNVGYFVISALCVAAVPRLSQHYTRGEERQFLRIGGALSLAAGGAGVVIFLAGFLWGPKLLATLFTAEFSQAAPALNWMLAGGALFYVSTAIGTVVSSTRSFAPQTVLSGVVAGVAMLGAYLLVPRYGIQGAAYASFVTMAVRLLGIAAVFAFLWRGRDAATKAAEGQA